MLNLKNNISFQLIRSIFGIYLIIAVLVTVTQIIIEFHATKNDIKNEMTVQDFAESLLRCLRSEVPQRLTAIEEQEFLQRRIQ